MKLKVLLWEQEMTKKQGAGDKFFPSNTTSC